MSDGLVLHVNISAGGVPKLPVDSARVTRLGLEGDAHREVTGHGGPHRAVSILGVEAIGRVAAEGNPIAPGTTGENLTISGFDVSSLPVGTRLAIGDEVVLELAWTANPCRTIRHSFRDLRFGRLSHAAHPADARMYARVVREGTLRPGQTIRILPPEGDSAENALLASRLDRGEAASSLAVWRAAAASGLDVTIVDDGNLAMSAAPNLPGPVFNLALGFAHLPHLVDRAVEHFAAQRTTGWVWTDEPPWPDAICDSTAALVAMDMTGGEPNGAGPDGARPDGLVVRELERREVGAWSSVIAIAAGLEPRQAAAFVALEPQLALAPHHHRFVAELDGEAVGAASLHLHHQVGWLRAGTVLPPYRGRGVQRAMIEERLVHAARLGCDLAGSLADVDSSSVRNLERVGGRVVATRGRYRIVPAA